MLEFKLNGKAFAFDERAGIRITIENPACYFEEIPGDVGMGIELPVNETNRLLLGNPESYDRRQRYNDREYPGFEVEYGGWLILSGTFVLQKSNKKRYSGWLRSEVGTLSKKHREKFIYDIPGFRKSVIFSNKANYDPDTDDYGCPEIFNPEFFKDKGRKVIEPISYQNPDYYPGSDEDETIEEDSEIEAMSKAFRRASQFFVNRRNGDNTINITPSESKASTIENDLDVHVVSPMLFLTKVVEIIFTDAGLKIGANALADDADMKRLVVYNNFDITIENITQKELLAEGTWYDGITGVHEYLTYYADFIYRHYNGSFQYKDLLPKVRLKDFLLGIQNLLNVCFVFRPNRKVDIIDREKIFEGNAYDVNDYMLDAWEIGEKKDMTLKFLFTQDDNDTFLKERWTDIDDRREAEKDPVNTWDDLMLIPSPELGEIRYIRSLNLYVEYAWIQHREIDLQAWQTETFDTLGWKHLALGFQNGYFNRGKDKEEEEITTVFGVVAGDQAATSYQPGNTRSTRFSYSAFSPRMLFYLGNNSGKYETSQLSLDWEKQDKGLLAKRWPKWVRFWSQCTPFTAEADFPIHILDYIRRNITQRFRCLEGEFIIEKIETEFGLEWIGTTTISGYKHTYLPPKVGVDEHWEWNNLILDEMLIDFGMVEIVKYW